MSKETGNKILFHWCVVARHTDGSLRYHDGNLVARMVHKNMLDDVRQLIEREIKLAPGSYTVMSISRIGEFEEDE